MRQEFERHVYAVQRYAAFTAQRYVPLFKSDVMTHPICSFGHIEKAHVITVGLNPSHGEFHKDRNWPPTMSHTDLAKRCCHYFHCSEESHRWFRPWSEALGHLGANYEAGTAAHLDLSPRATRFVSEFKEAWEQTLFLEMVERDLWTFFGTLALCRQVELILMAGSVTGRYYINEFLGQFAPEHGYSLDGSFDRLEQRGSGKVAFHVLSDGNREIRVFFCSTSPSGKHKTILPQRVKENAEKLVSGKNVRA